MPTTSEGGRLLITPAEREKDGIEAVGRQFQTCGSAPEGPGAVARLEILFCCHVDDRFGQHGQSGIRRLFSYSVVSRRADRHPQFFSPRPESLWNVSIRRSFFPINIWRNKMSNLDNQPGRDNRAGFDNRTPDQRTGLDNRSTGIGTGTIAAIIAAVVIAGALMLFGPWGTNRSSINNSTPTSSNSTPGTTAGQTPSGAPRVIAPAVAPAAPTTTASPAPNSQ